MVAEYGSTGAMTHRYVHGAGADMPLIDYAGSGLTQPSYLHADERGSIVALSDGTGASAINRYDEYGLPQGNLAGRFGYTGQAWISELGLYHYKARAYSPTLGRFLQTDPIGYGGGMNLYAYVLNDPVNLSDPSGLLPPLPEEQELTVVGRCRGDLVMVGNVCVSGADLRTIIFGRETFTFTTFQIPDIDPETGCTSSGNVVTCPLGPTPKAQCTRVQIQLQHLGESVTQIGGSVSDIGISVSIIGGGIAVAGVVTGDVPMAAFGASVIAEGGREIAVGGGIALVGGLMQAAGGRPGDAIGGMIGNTLTRNLPIPNASRTWLSDRISSGV